MTRQAAIAGSAEIIEDDFGAQSLFQRVFHWLLAFAIMPFCFVTVVTLFQKAGEAKTLGAFWKSSEFVYLITGVGLMIGWFLVGVVNNLFLYLYVLGHEMTHAFFVYCCFGRVSDMKVSLDGGYIMTNKSNILIALSPYFVPFWSAVAITIEVILSFFWDIPYLDSVLIGVIGATWCFHIIWTVWMIPKDQPDLREHGTFFSLMVIIFANLILLSMMLCATSKELKLADFAFNWWNNVLDLSEAFMGLLTRLL